jgi:hypothetical protein
MLSQRRHWRDVLGCGVVYSGRSLLTFRRDLLSQFSRYSRPPKVRLVRDQSMVGQRTIAFSLHVNEFWPPENVNISHYISLANAWIAK